MNDSSAFLKDSLFCEYAYIINVDTQQLEFYSGFNQKSRERKGRYAKEQKENATSDTYFGVVLLLKIDLYYILGASDEEVSEIIEKMEKKSSSFYARQERDMKKEKK